MCRKKKFLVLRFLIAEANYELQDFAPLIGLNPTQLYNRLRGETPWGVAEALAACDALGQDYSELGKLFKDCREEA